MSILCPVAVFAVASAPQDTRSVLPLSSLPSLLVLLLSSDGVPWLKGIGCCVGVSICVYIHLYPKLQSVPSS